MKRSLGLLGLLFLSGSALASYTPYPTPGLSGLSCEPESETVPQSAGLPSLRPGSSKKELPTDVLDLAFCKQWNPEYGYRKYFCCPKKWTSLRERRCPQARAKTSFCSERTQEQLDYIEAIESGKLADTLKQAQSKTGYWRPRVGQAFCSVNDGFLAFGKAVVPSSQNRIELRNGHRCLNFGTDPLVAMLEWLGKKVAEKYSAPEYSGVKLLIGDVSAPKGGCLPGRRGRPGHMSHTNGRDVDIGFLTAKAKHPSPLQFHRGFDSSANLWMIKQIFSNPFACVQAVFLDRRLINALQKVGGKDPEWSKIRSFVRHQRAHRNHMHTRVGFGPDEPGCPLAGEPRDIEEVEELDEEPDPEPEAL